MLRSKRLVKNDIRKSKAYVSPSVESKNREFIGDEFWWAVVVLLFAVRVYSNYALTKTIKACENQGGSAKVSSHMFGTSWTVSCYK
ncbi:hypothetical protein CU633_21790 [Bacillus sp. V3-13]|uniref:hypothetical protein n=1 Tax=Bacillus sp. V3-13 TaxID=2053728 RepID=UPI000C779FFA|nr:hypothetical protein [Bacillus sp. V3-13]PLR75318.1 hypothetical protein CU633_21790 [Bacillus sp. V3-13]